MNRLDLARDSVGSDHDDQRPPDHVRVKEHAFFVGNLAFTASEDDVIGAFAALGLKVSVVVLPRDTDGVRNRGFGFVTALCDDAPAAVERLYGTEIGGRRIRVELAKEPTIKTMSGRVW